MYDSGPASAAFKLDEFDECSRRRDGNSADHAGGGPSVEHPA